MKSTKAVLIVSAGTVGFILPTRVAKIDNINGKEYKYNYSGARIQ